MMQLKYRGLSYELAEKAMVNREAGISARYRGLTYEIGTVSPSQPRPAGAQLRFRGTPYCSDDGFAL